MWNSPHTIMQFAMVIRFVMILAIALLGLSVGALTLMLRRWLHREHPPAAGVFERRLS
jgi:type IV secretory pathway TrbD component